MNKERSQGGRLFWTIDKKETDRYKLKIIVEYRGGSFSSMPNRSN